MSEIKERAPQAEYNIDPNSRIVDLNGKTGASHIGITLIINCEAQRNGAHTGRDQ